MESPRPIVAPHSVHVPLTERRFIWPLILVTCLFFLWAVGVNLNDILIPHLHRAFHLTGKQPCQFRADDLGAETF